MLENSYPYIPILTKEWNRRKAQNNQFSLRAFARFLNMSPSLLSQILSGKRRLTKTQALKIADRLDFSPAERMYLLTTLFSDSIDAPIIPHRQILEEDQFSLIADWYHYGILGLASLEFNESSPKWIARRLSISENTAVEALRRLLRLKLIEITDSSLRQITPPLDTTDHIPSGAIKRHHKQNLDLAKEKIDQVDLNKREYSSITMAINPKQFKKARELITEFQYKLSEILEQGPKTEVYTFATQLFPVTVSPEEA